MKTENQRSNHGGVFEVITIPIWFKRCLAGKCHSPTLITVWTGFDSPDVGIKQMDNEFG